MDIQSALFNLPEDIHYLNCAYMSPLLNSTVEIGQEAVTKKSTPYKIKVDDFFEHGNQLRIAFAKLIGCNDPNQIVSIPAVSYGISSISNNLTIPRNSNIILAGEQFPSNAYPWFRIGEKLQAEVKIIAPPNGLEDRGKNWNQSILDAINKNTSVVAISHCHWADGTLFDLHHLREKTSEVDAALVIDGTQSIGALPFDVNDIRPDALICGGYKWLLGPYSLGLAYYDPRYNNGIPVEENWINRKFSENFSGLVDYQDAYQPGALRYEVGEHSNFTLVPMLLNALEQILQWTPEKIQEYCKSITKDGIERLKKHGFWVENDDLRGSHLFGIRLPSQMDIKQLQMVMEQRNIFVSIRGSSIRVSPHVYNSRTSFNLLVDTLVNEIQN